MTLREAEDRLDVEELARWDAIFREEDTALDKAVRDANRNKNHYAAASLVAAGIIRG